MKLLRVGKPGHERPATLDTTGQLRDLSAQVTDLDGSALSEEGLAALRSLDLDKMPPIAAGVRVGPCVAGVGKFICIGLNYADHAAEAGMSLPEEPAIFLKATSSISGANDDIVLPQGSSKSDWEVELGFVIGTKASYVAENDALGHVAGYFIVNDLSERDFQLHRGGQWTKGKSCDTFGPIGPWLVTSDEIPDPQTLSLQLAVNGETMQSGSTKEMVFGVAKLVSYLSRFMTLFPGDIVSTGTPAGVGFGRKPPVYLQAGDRINAGLAGLGEQIQHVVTG